MRIQAFQNTNIIRIESVLLPMEPLEQQQQLPPHQPVAMRPSLLDSGRAPESIPRLQQYMMSAQNDSDDNEEDSKQPSLIERLVNSEDGTHFQCQVCQDLLQDPRECSKCRNVFCYSCIDKWQSKSHSFQTLCPLRCKGVEMMRISIPFKNQLESLKLRCVNFKLGCPEIAPFGELLKHQNLCSYMLKKCPHIGCGQKVLVSFLEEHILNCECLPIPCPHCAKLTPQGRLQHHLEEQCESIFISCEVCSQTVQRRLLNHHLDFDCSENEIRCSHYPKCRDRFKKKELEQHLKSTCLFAQITCSKCQLTFLRQESGMHDCLLSLIKRNQMQQVKLQTKKEKIKEMQGEIKRLKEVIREKDRRIMEIENGLSIPNVPQDVNNPSAALQEEQKEQFYRRDPTFHNEKSLAVYEGGSIETLIFMKNGHLALSGSCQTNKLTICGRLSNDDEEYKVVAEFTDHISTITGLLEFNNRLISCGIDKNIVVYDIVKKPIQSGQLKKSDGAGQSLFSCFFSKPKKQTSFASISDVSYHYSYLKHNIILNAHNSQINCIQSINDKYFATGGMKEVKIWKFYECIHVIANAHQNSVLSMKVFKIMNHIEKAYEQVLATGSKDKQLKLWSLATLNESGDDGQQQVCLRNLNEMTLSHYSQVNTFSQLNENVILTGTSDGKIQFWQQRLPQAANNRADQMNQSMQSSRFHLSHSAQIFTVSTLHIQQLTSYDYNEYPYVAIAGMVSKVIIYDVKNQTIIQSLRVLISNWQTYNGIIGLPEDRLAVGCLYGTIKVYKATYE
ncbi:hypothetical protein FGO68_gene14731 [Halteria grandinella]|uniref:Uncharacterized protein n=1 Tax=Halteria grandinella TaxID=5974 RepID=A0A8J8T5Z3_HALGN|nr:hypothetical protein FGO68_gene14731 [Halteria grandinella]